VIAIIAILAALLLPALKGARDRAKIAVCSSNLRQTHVGATLYADDFNGWLPVFGFVGYPWGSPWAQGAVDVNDLVKVGGLGYLLGLKNKYVPNWWVFICPSRTRDVIPYYVKYWNGSPGGAGIMGYYTFNGNNTNEPGYDPTYVAGRLGDSPNLLIAVDYSIWNALGIGWDYSLDANGAPNTSHQGVNVLYVDGHVSFSPFNGNSTNGFNMVNMSGYNDFALSHK